MTVRPMVDADLSAAAVLLGERHRRHRAASPLLDGRFEAFEDAVLAVMDVWRAPSASGAVAVRDGRLVGYLIGHPKDVGVWGDNVWVESAGLALAADEDVETARDLYACAAARWVSAGRTVHYVLVPAHDTALVDAWFRLCFGLQHVHAAREPASRSSHTGSMRAGSSSRVNVRRAVRADIPMLGRLDVVLPDHQAGSPVFSAGHRPSVEEATAEWVESFDDERFTTFVAEVDGDIVGSAIAGALAVSSLHTGPARLDDAALLGFAAVSPARRGLGAGRALGEAVIDWAAVGGYRSVVADWRATNLLSSRTWPRLGFEPTFLRLHRACGY